MNITYTLTCDACGLSHQGNHLTVALTTRRPDGTPSEHSKFDVCSDCYATVSKLMTTPADWVPLKGTKG